MADMWNESEESWDRWKKENGFEFYEYMWEKDSTKIRVEICGKGRGLRLIETEDYKISIIAENNELELIINIILHIIL